MGKKLLYQDDFHIIIVDGKGTSVKNPISIYHKALMGYRQELDLEVIALFEKLLVLYKLFKDKDDTFFYKLTDLENELHLKRSRLYKARQFLIKHKICSESNPGKGKRMQFTINKDRIIALVPYLYMMPEEDSAKTTLIHELQTYYKYYFDKDFAQKSNTGSNYKGKKSISGLDKRNIMKAETKDSDNSI